MFMLIRQAIVATLFLALVLCAAYPAGVYLAGVSLVPEQAGGSLLKDGDTVVGSALIGQNFTGAEYFHGRPSAAGEQGYTGNASSGSNFGPTSKALAERMKASADALRKDNPQAGTLPIELLTASGSGLDPHITPAGAMIQAKRVAAARQLPLAQVEALITAQSEGPEWGFWGGDRINVLRLNMALRKLNTP